MAESEERAKRAHRHEAHDWHTPGYVDEWIAHDLEREDRRRPLLARMMAAAPFPHDAKLRVLDVGCGYGAVTDAVLGAFPNASITLQDFSPVMLDRARKHLAGRAGPIAYVQGDLTDDRWNERVGGPFDLAVSGIAIHNLRDMKAIAAVYRAIHGLLVPGGCFLDSDHFAHAGGTDAHLTALKAAGFDSAEAIYEEGSTGIVRAVRKG
jgi:SAM-dependent methyltransferase